MMRPINQSLKKESLKNSVPDLPTYGKITKEIFDSVIYPKLGASRPEVVVGPAIGVDTCAINVAEGEVLVATTDPMSYIPELGPADSAWLSVNMIASDLATSSFKPQYAIFDLNLPPSMTSNDFQAYWNALSDECRELGIAIVGGHTGKFEGCDYTVVGGGTMFSLGAANRYVSSKGGSPGDNLIVTKGAAIAATGILARVFHNYIEKNTDTETAKKGAECFKEITVVEDALAASSVGVRSAGVTAMHDATEGGVLSALRELAAASSAGLYVEKEKIPVLRDTKSICDLFHIDPLTSVGEGSLVIACQPRYTPDVVSALEKSAIPCEIVGELRQIEFRYKIVDDKGIEGDIEYPVVDPYWNAYYLAKKIGLN